GVFAAGDNLTGPKTAIEAIVGAKEASIEINTYLTQFMPISLPDPNAVPEIEEVPQPQVMIPEENIVYKN
ncbi:MAG: hypothetical protein ACXAE3_00210, partial [Candidatus Kariarchaeaceae archaeon]